MAAIRQWLLDAVYWVRFRLVGRQLCRFLKCRHDETWDTDWAVYVWCNRCERSRMWINAARRRAR